MELAERVVPEAARQPTAAGVQALGDRAAAGRPSPEEATPVEALLNAKQANDLAGLL
jgi:hypothetical protein